MHYKGLSQKQALIMLSPKGYGTLVFLILAIYFRFIGGTWLIHINSYYHNILNAGILLLVFSVWFVWKYFLDNTISTTGLEIYLAALILVIIVSTIFADNFNLSAEIALGVIGLMLSIYIFLDIKRSDVLWDALEKSIVIAGAINVILILARIAWWINLYQVKLIDIFQRPNYLFAILPRLPDIPNFNPNVTALYLLLLLPIMIYKAVQSKSRAMKYLLGAFSLGTVMIVGLTKSRGALIGLGFSLVVTAISYRRDIIAWYKQKPLFSLLSLFCSILGLGLGASFIFKSRGFLLGSSMQGRIEGWRIAWKIIQTRPIFGAGLGSYGLRFLKLRNPTVYSLLNFHAHNEILNITTTIGLAGLIVIGLLVWHFLKLINNEQNLKLGAKKVYLISLAGFVGMGLVDSYFDSSNITLLIIFLMVGLLPENSLKKIKTSKSMMGFVLVILICIGSAEFYANWKLAAYYESGESVYKRNLSEVNKNIDEALRRDPENPIYQYFKAQVVGEMECDQNSISTESVALYNEIYPIYGNWGPFNANAAVLSAGLNDFQNGIQNLKKAIDSDPEESIYYCLLGDYQFRMGSTNQALNSYKTCLSLNAGWVDTPYWQNDPFKTASLNEIVETMAAGSMDANNKNLSEYAAILLHEGRLEEIASLLLIKLDEKEVDPSLRLLYATYLIETGNSREALDTLIKLTDQHPRFSDAWTSLARLYLDLGKMDESLRAINISSALKKTAENQILSGVIYSRMGNFPKAIDQYYSGLFWKKQNSIMAEWTARRFSILGENLSCMPDMRTFEGFYDYAWIGINELAPYDCKEAENLYMIIENDLFAGFNEKYGSFQSICSY